MSDATTRAPVIRTVQQFHQQAKLEAAEAEVYRLNAEIGRLLTANMARLTQARLEMEKVAAERDRLDWFARVAEFHVAFDCERAALPCVPRPETMGLRLQLMREELNETWEAMDQDDLPGIADGLADLVYVAIGTAVAYGIDLRPVFAEVHAANLRKLGGPVREDGKREKPPGFTPPDVAGVLARQEPIREIGGTA